jgi:hypothetical protein
MSTNEQLQALREDGFVHLPGAVPTHVVDAMRERLWHLLEAKGAKRGDASTWDARFAYRLQKVRKGDPDPRACQPLCEALDRAFCETEWFTKPHWGQALVTFPTTDSWTLPKTLWHLDHPFVQGKVISGVNLFLFVDAVEPRGGGTLVLRSSSQLIERFVEQTGTRNLLGMKTKEIRFRLFEAHSFLQELTGGSMRPDRSERMMERDSDLDGIAVRVVELVGKPGDVVLTHPWLLHAGSPNVNDRPRLMRASRVYRRDIYEKYMKAPSESA